MGSCRAVWRRGVILTAIGLAWGAAGLRAQEVAPVDPAATPEGVQVLTRGPVHEAFAEPVVYDPRPGPVIPKVPPQPVEELPPDQRPEGANVQWIPGYWSWDDSRNDFIWVSGLWRDVPPGRQWVPGYWSEADGGFRWVPGEWVGANSQGVQYLPAPPASLESGPSSPAPAAGAVWSPGTWVWQNDRYAWRPGFWVNYQPDWVWVPAHYAWSPGGYLFVDGYWDRPLQQRGTPFAPVYFSQPVYRQQNFAYTPSVGLLASGLASSLFVRPSYGQYYFGDYYAASNFSSGIYPWYSFHQSRYGYDPLFAQYAARNLRDDPRWLDNLHDQYRYRREHAEARPPRTWPEYQRFAGRSLPAGSPAALSGNTVLMARPFNQMVSAPTQSLRYTRVEDAGRRQMAADSTRLREFREQRMRGESEAARSFAGRPGPATPNPAMPAGRSFADRPRPASPTPGAPAGRSFADRPATPTPTPTPGAAAPAFQPRRLELPRSPIVAPPARDDHSLQPPATPAHPAFDASARPRPPDQPHPLPEPHPDYRPQPSRGPAGIGPGGPRPGSGGMTTLPGFPRPGQGIGVSVPNPNPNPNPNPGAARAPGQAPGAVAAPAPVPAPARGPGGPPPGPGAGAAPKNRRP